MDKKSKIFLVLFFGAILLSILFSYYNFVVKENYTVFYSEDEIPEQTDINSILKL